VLKKNATSQKSAREIQELQTVSILIETKICSTRANITIVDEDEGDPI